MANHKDLVNLAGIVPEATVVIDYSSIDDDADFIEYRQGNQAVDISRLFHGRFEELNKLIDGTDTIISPDAFYNSNHEEALTIAYDLLPKGGILVARMKRQKPIHNVKFQVYKAFELAIHEISPGIDIPKPEVKSYEEEIFDNLAYKIGFVLEEKNKTRTNLNEKDARSLAEIYSKKFESIVSEARGENALNDIIPLVWGMQLDYKLQDGIYTGYTDDYRFTKH